jgi:mannose-6-phosphate isomerase-like protein (cupin superfamily)
MKTHYADIPVYITKDGSEIRELLHPDHHAIVRQSFAEATIAAGQRTRLHRHLSSEEIYHVTAGKGRMTLDDTQFDIAVGDSIAIPPGTPHCVEALGDAPLKILCSCSPAYSHADTKIVE